MWGPLTVNYASKTPKMGCADCPLFLSPVIKSIDLKLASDLPDLHCDTTDATGPAVWPIFNPVRPTTTTTTTVKELHRF